MKHNQQAKKIKMGTLVLWGGILLTALSLTQEQKSSKTEANKPKSNIINSSYVSDPSGINDLVYRSYGDAYSLGKGSTWKIQKEIDGIDLTDYENAKIYVVNLQSGVTTSILRDKIQEDVEYEIQEDGVYKIYLCLDENNSKDVIDLKPYLKIAYCDSCETKEDSSGILLLNHSES